MNITINEKTLQDIVATLKQSNYIILQHTQGLTDESLKLLPLDVYANNKKITIDLETILSRSNGVSFNAGKEIEPKPKAIEQPADTSLEQILAKHNKSLGFKEIKAIESTIEKEALTLEQVEACLLRILQENKKLKSFGAYFNKCLQNERKRLGK